MRRKVRINHSGKFVGKQPGGIDEIIGSVGLHWLWMDFGVRWDFDIEFNIIFGWAYINDFLLQKDFSPLPESIPS